MRGCKPPRQKPLAHRRRRRTTTRKTRPEHRSARHARSRTMAARVAAGSRASRPPIASPSTASRATPPRWREPGPKIFWSRTCQSIKSFGACRARAAWPRACVWRQRAAQGSVRASGQWRSLLDHSAASSGERSLTAQSHPYAFATASRCASSRCQMCRNRTNPPVRPPSSTPRSGAVDFQAQALRGARASGVTPAHAQALQQPSGWHFRLLPLY